MNRIRRVAVLGSTRSIGTSCLDVVAHLGARLRIQSLSAHANWQELRDQARRFRPRRVAVTDPDAARQLGSALDGLCEVLRGPDALADLAADPQADVVVSAVVGSAGPAGAGGAPLDRQNPPPPHQENPGRAPPPGDGPAPPPPGGACAAAEATARPPPP